MATRSNIGKRLPNGKIHAVYCHWDGYPEHNGNILVNHYKDDAKVEALLALGALSILGEEIGQKQDFNKPTEGWCLAYGRDRGETRTSGTIVDDVRELTGNVDYVYVWENGAWTCYNDEKIIDLTKEIEHA